MNPTPEAVLGAAPHLRRFNFDVTNTVEVSSAETVRRAVFDLYAARWPQAPLDQLWVAFHDFERLYTGRMPGFEGCDTVYHDIQHTLDVTLTMARLVAGYERSADTGEQLGPERAMLGIICALFHDAGYIRESGDTRYYNGAEYTLCHVARSAKFLRNYLPRIGLSAAADIAAELVHFTGYEKQPADIELDDPLDSMTGHLLGTADLLAQMADRCYLEKCRDRLYPEFVLGGVAITQEDSGVQKVRYQSGLDLLLQTPAFYKDVVKKRLDLEFNKAYHYVEVFFNGFNPYMQFIERNIAYLEHVIETGEWPALRRVPPCYTGNENPLLATNVLVNRRIAALRAEAMVLARA